MQKGYAHVLKIDDRTEPKKLLNMGGAIPGQNKWEWEDPKTSFQYKNNNTRIRHGWIAEITVGQILQIIRAVNFGFTQHPGKHIRNTIYTWNM